MNPRPVALAGDPPVDAELARAHGLTADEFTAIIRHLGRLPTYTELGVFAVMWSEHCSYKSSRIHLRKLPQDGPQVVGGAGENAGAIDVGDGWVAVFKIESHNHPSFVEPRQGAATGVGGILRDIFTMGARPVASMDSLKFGAFDHPRTRYLLSGVVAGIGGYGNCVGVPTVAGEVMFDPGYNGNILVNAFCLGLARREELQSARARGPGNPVYYVGSATGRDGIHGASLLASAEFDAASEAKRPTVQVGDPFTEKLLIEACLEAMKTGAIVAIQDMGAAGLTSSSSEMAARGGLGIELDLDRVPLREVGLTPYEILLSESQERMLLVAERGREHELTAIFAKWELHAVEIGRITDDAHWRARYRGNAVAEIPIAALNEAAPLYDRPATPPAPASPAITSSFTSTLPAPADALRTLLGSPNIGSKRWVYRQYDSLVQSNTVAGPGGDAAVLRIKGTRRGLAVTVDSNPRACAIDPYRGTAGVVCEAARNLACVGARPAGITNCLNFGNPERPEIMWQFVQAVAGLSDAARAFATPVISGNVSFYNETEGRAIPPTPTIAMVGMLPELSRYLTYHFKFDGDLILLVRTAAPALAASEYAAQFKVPATALAPLDLGRERRLLDGLIESAERDLLSSAHDVGDGGLLVAVAEACFNPENLLGATLARAPGPDGSDPTGKDSTWMDLIGKDLTGMETAKELFGEGPSSVILSAPPTNLEAIHEIFAGLEMRVIGRVTAAPRLRLEGVLDVACDALRRDYEQALSGRLAQ